MSLKKSQLDKILDDTEIFAVRNFIENDIMREAVKKVLLFGIYNNGVLIPGKVGDPTLNFSLGLVANAEDLHLDNEKLGAQLRAAWEGIKFVEVAFSNMAQYKDDKVEKPSTDNPAR